MTRHSPANLPATRGAKCGLPYRTSTTATEQQAGHRSLCLGGNGPRLGIDTPSPPPPPTITAVPHRAIFRNYMKWP